MLHSGNHTCRDHPLTFSASWRLEPKISNLDSSDQSTDFHWFNVHSLCFLAQASLFFLLFFLSCGFLAGIRPWRPDSRSLPWTADVEMCLLLELCGAFMFPLIWGAVTLRFLRLVTLMNVSSASEVTLGLRVLGRSSWEQLFLSCCFSEETSHKVSNYISCWFNFVLTRRWQLHLWSNQRKHRGR